MGQIRFLQSGNIAYFEVSREPGAYSQALHQGLCCVVVVSLICIGIACTASIHALDAPIWDLSIHQWGTL